MEAALITGIITALFTGAIILIGLKFILKREDPALSQILQEQMLNGLRSEAETTRRALNDTERALQETIRQAMAGTLEKSFKEMQATGQLVASSLKTEGTGTRELLDHKLSQMQQSNEARLIAIEKTVNEQLQTAVEKQMNNSFTRVIEQFTAVQKAVADMSAMASEISDVKRIFANVKNRGTWGEKQLEGLLQDFLPGRFQTNIQLSESSREIVEFALEMPVKNSAAGKPLLAIDAKFPTEDYERLLQAGENGDREGELAARAALGKRILAEGKKIAEKYICPPKTVDFAVLYLPSEGLYAETAAIPGLIDELGHRKVFLMGPILLPAMLKTIELGYLTLAMEENAETVKQLLSVTKAEMSKLDGIFDKLLKNSNSLTGSIEAAKKRTGILSRKLKTVAQATEAEIIQVIDSSEEMLLPAPDYEEV